MAQEGRLTPEKQLLKIIEDPKSQGSAGEARVRATGRRGLSLFSPAAWKGRATFAQGAFKKAFSVEGLSRLNIKAVNLFLLICAFGLVLYLGNNIYLSIAGLNSMPDFKAEVRGGVKSAPFLEASTIKAASYYLEKIMERNIFKMGAKIIKETPGAEPLMRAASSSTMDAMSHLKLVGISWSDDPDALIEDTKRLKTYFVKRGHMVGNIKVQAIFKNKVVLSYKGEELELR